MPFIADQTLKTLWEQQKTQSEQRRIQALKSTEEAQKKAKEANSLFGMVKNFVGALPEGFIKTVTLGGNIPKFIHSVSEIPETWKTGKATQTEYDLPILGKQKSFISEAETRAGDIIEGKDWVEPITGKVTPRPLWSALSPFVEVPATGLAMIPGMQALTGDVALTGSTAMNLKVPEWVNKGGQIQIQPQLSPGQVIPSQVPQIIKDIYESGQGLYEKGKGFITKTGEKQAYDEVIKDFTPSGKMSDTQYQKYMEEGMINEKTQKWQPSPDMKKAAQTVVDSGVSMKGNDVEKYNSILAEANGHAQDVKRATLIKYSVPVNEGRVNSIIDEINAVNPDPAFGDSGKSMVDKMKNYAIDLTKNNIKMSSDIDSARIDFDNFAQMEKAKIFDPNIHGAAKNTALQIRNIFENNQSSMLPSEIKSVYLDSLDFEHNLFNAADYIKDVSTAPKSLWQRIPWPIKKSIPWVAGGLGLGGGYGAGRLFGK